MEGEFQAGRALGRGFGIWLKNLVPFMALSLFVYSPLIVYTALTVSGELTLQKITMWGRVVPIGGYFLGVIASAAMLYGVIEDLHGKRPGIGALIGVGLKRMLPVIGVGILSALAMFAGFICLIVPGIILMCMLYVAVPAAVIERPGVVGALKRSQELTGGYKLQIFGIIIILGLIQWGAQHVLQSAMIGATPTMSDLKVFLGATLGIVVVLSSLQAAVSGVVYHDLRVAKEGVATEDLARVFE